MTNAVVERLLPVRRCTPFLDEVVVREIPPSAEALVQVGDRVSATQPIARPAGCGSERQLVVVDVAGDLELPTRDVSAVMLRRRGDVVAAGEMVAARRGRLPFLYRPCRVPVGGRIVALVHGWLVLETVDEPSAIPALVPGLVEEITLGRAIAIRYRGAVMEGVWGSGGAAVGRLDCSDVTPSPEQITESAHAAILVIPGCATPDLTQRAAAMGVAGLVAGSVSVELADAVPLPVVATEGFGSLTMAADRLGLLRGLAGRVASLVTSWEGRWQGRPPAVFVPGDEPRPEDQRAGSHASVDRPVRTGDRVCAVCAPFVGRVGHVGGIRPSGGTRVAGAWQDLPVQFDDSVPTEAGASGQVEWVPWLNLERIG